MKYVYVVDKDEDIRHIRISLSEKDGAITIQIENEEDPSDPWDLAALQSDGTLLLYRSLPDNLGLQLDDVRRVKTVKE